MKNNIFPSLEELSNPIHPGYWLEEEKKRIRYINAVRDALSEALSKGISTFVYIKDGDKLTRAYFSGRAILDTEVEYTTMLGLGEVKCINGVLTSSTLYEIYEQILEDVYDEGIIVHLRASKDWVVATNIYYDKELHALILDISGHKKELW